MKSSSEQVQRGIQPRLGTCILNYGSVCSQSCMSELACCLVCFASITLQCWSLSQARSKAPAHLWGGTTLRCPAPALPRWVVPSAAATGLPPQAPKVCPWGCFSCAMGKPASSIPSSIIL